jgi:DNA primase large subunit
MDRLHARYPFLEAAREAVEDADADLLDLATAGDAAVERAVERVEASLSGGTVGEAHRSARVELLSYPVARVLVSLVDRPALVRRYANAEARTAHERFAEELTADADYRSTGGQRLSLQRLLAEFDLASAVHGGEPLTVEGEVRIHVGAYLSLSAELEGDRWRLTTRRLRDGLVPVTGRGLLLVLREAVRERVADGLPFDDVPEPIADALAPQVERLRDQLGDHRPPGRLEVVVPELFPPCVRTLLDRALAGEELPAHSRYALIAFLTSAGMHAEDVSEALPLDAAAYQAERLGSEAGGGYAPPTCATMQSYGDGETDFGDCVAPDERTARCDAVPDPLTYYAEAIGEAEEVEPLEEAAGLSDRLGRS